MYVNLLPNDGDVITVDLAAVTKSRLIMRLVSHHATIGDAAPQPIAIPHSSRVLNLIVDWCITHMDEPSFGEIFVVTDTVHAWDQTFFTMDAPTLHEVIVAANYLEITSLFDAACIANGKLLEKKADEDLHRAISTNTVVWPNRGTQADGEPRLPFPPHHILLKIAFGTGAPDPQTSADALERQLLAEAQYERLFRSEHDMEMFTDQPGPSTPRVYLPRRTIEEEVVPPVHPEQEVQPMANQSAVELNEEDSEGTGERSDETEDSELC